MYKGKKIAIVIPCYKVSNSISKVVRDLPNFVDKVYLVDDKCPENSLKNIKFKSKKINGRTTSLKALPIVALKISLSKGDILQESDFEYLLTEKKIGGGTFHDKNQLIGRKIKRALPVGTIMRTRHLEADWIINKNQKVIIEHKLGNILINAVGVAQEPGRLGEKILVKNFKSGKNLLCWIINDKKVITNIYCVEQVLFCPRF